MNKKLIINIYNQEIKKESIQYEDKIKYKAPIFLNNEYASISIDYFL